MVGGDVLESDPGSGDAAVGVDECRDTHVVEPLILHGENGTPRFALDRIARTGDEVDDAGCSLEFGDSVVHPCEDEVAVP